MLERGIDRDDIAAAMKLSKTYVNLVFLGERWIGGLGPEQLRGLAGLLNISTLGAYLLANALKVTDLFRASTLDEQLRNVQRHLVRDREARLYALSDDAWERMPIEARVWCALTYQRSIGRMILEPFPRFEVTTPIGVTRNATPVIRKRLAGSALVDAILKRIKQTETTLTYFAEYVDLSPSYCSVMMRGARPIGLLPADKLRLIGLFLDVSTLTVFQLAEVFTEADLFPTGDALDPLKHALDLISLDVTFAHHLPQPDVWAHTSAPARRLSAILYHRARIRTLIGNPEHD